MSSRHKRRSTYICKRCGLAVYQWEGSRGTLYWKHAAGGGAGRTRERHDPTPIAREEVGDGVTSTEEIRALKRLLRRE